MYWLRGESDWPVIFHTLICCRQTLSDCCIFMIYGEKAPVPGRKLGDNPEARWFKVMPSLRFKQLYSEVVVQWLIIFLLFDIRTGISVVRKPNRFRMYWCAQLIAYLCTRLCPYLTGIFERRCNVSDHLLQFSSQRLFTCILVVSLQHHECLHNLCTIAQAIGSYSNNSLQTGKCIATKEYMKKHRQRLCKCRHMTKLYSVTLTS